MAKTKTTKKTKAWRFYASRLETIVWDADNNCKMADFTEGHYTTDNKNVAKKLRDLGYIEIPLDATGPPNIIVNQPSHNLVGNIPIMNNAVNERVMEKKMEKVTKVDERIVPPQLPKKTPRVRA